MRPITPKKKQQIYKCVRCRSQLNAPSVDHLCIDCREVVPRKRGLTDLTSLHRRVVKPKPFIDEDGNELFDELPMRPLWQKPRQNEWAASGMDKHSRIRNHIDG